jgi:LPXTG-site transpeptidase (sortase) family protein
MSAQSKNMTQCVIFTIINLFILFQLTGCRTTTSAISNPASTVSLPPPVQHVTEIPVVSSATPLPKVKLSATPFPDSLEGAARAQYGSQLIEWIEIEKIGVLAPVTPVGWSTGGDLLHKEEPEWDSPEAQVGWMVTSALPSQIGNIILYGHNNIDSSIFMHLFELESGDMVELTTGERTWRYQVDQVKILPVLEEDDDQQAYAEYLKPSLAPRLTILSCYPPTNNTHRVIVIAYPVVGN